ncbi:hypothetical protein [Vibrio phage JSF23]|jgi:hypothetical protein|uniref:Uncharacterized protein n=4 Tax=Icepovirus bengalense TaxID=2846603 RepID=A0A076G597_9CAUD|nr:hypothetical protein [Vibrio cholerae]YP_004251210.1 hypothetical protein ViPhICP2p39 [Vibrio phage ICP2]YP_009056250.1 hypothetical protein LD36_gp38 [Vibrio phage ICP2_2013_A_Haiti]ADX87790.1 hypothetical protein TU12-16_00180 [Vibrio phage ICP2_2006_A]AII27083.1 hypothetical protein ICP22011A_0039 [Vibrio phage ICP2_2011_A]ASV43736.1 hypothetical protein [Vibrio phage JSF23]ASV43832.1 hypothetical protein [Vibrio phage JSF27]WJJ54312.1 hypothetical protein [Vibrio phage JPW]
MKRFAIAYTAQEGRNTKVKVFWTNAEDKEIAMFNFKYYREEQTDQHIINWYEMHQITN